MTRSLLRIGLLLAAFALGAIALARGLGLPWEDAGLLVRNTLIGSSIAAAVSLLWFSRRQRRSMRALTVGLALGLVGIVIAGIVAAAASMFISGHDFRALLVVTTVATGASLGVALHLGQRLGEDAALVRQEFAEVDAVAGHSCESRSGVLQIAEMHDLARHLRQASRELNLAHDRERAVESSRRELVAWISHDLRGPLASIRALAEALEDDIVVDPDDIDRYHRSIRREAERLSMLVDDLFELSRVQAGAVAVDSSKVPITEVIEDAMVATQGIASTKGVDLVMHGELRDALDVPAADVLRIVRNLLDNAVRHTPQGGTVHLHARTEPGAVWLRVTDECGGIPENELSRVFDVAFRGDVARRRDGSGGGLGLAIARGLAEAHAGGLDVCNDGPGCRFELRIPAH